MNLYNAYRPDDLSSFVGNKAAVRSLKSVLTRELPDVPHAFLFTGPSGCGKTTLARIVSNSLSCVGMDYTELDSAEFGGVDMIRDLRRNMGYSPIQGKTRVWLLDECHELSKQAQNALLKVLEDTPKHVYIILSTTEPEKLIQTIKTRCATFEVTPLTDAEMESLLDYVQEKEGVRFPKDVVQEIIINAGGSARRALVLVDQIIDLSENEMLESAKKTEVFQSKIQELCQALVKRSKWKQISQILKGLKGEQPESIRRAVLGYCAAVILNNGDPRLYAVLDSFSEDTFTTGFAGIVKAAFEVTLED